MQNPSNKEGFFVLYFRGWVIGYNGFVYDVAADDRKLCIIHNVIGIPYFIK